MRIMRNFKAHYLCFIITSAAPFSNAIASSIEILVDAALDQSALQTANDVSLNVAHSAGNDHSIGLIVYDEVFQRSTQGLNAGDTSVQRISEVFSAITPSEHSNVAVGIEKGISDLEGDGGLLLVLGNNDIQIADSKSATKYRDWLQLVLLPDAANKSISIILASPQSASTNGVDDILLEHPNNKVISYTDTTDLLNQLSALLPFQLSTDSPIAAVTAVEPSDTATLAQNPQLAADQTDQSALPVAGETESTLNNEPEKVSVNSYILMAIALFAFLVVAVAMLLRKLLRSGKSAKLNQRDVPSDAKSIQSRYLPPNQDPAAVLTTRMADTQAQSAASRAQQPDGSRGVERFGANDETIVMPTDSSISGDSRFDKDITGEPNPDVGGDLDQPMNVEPATTVLRKAISPDDKTIYNEEGAVDELEELRTLTQAKQFSQVD